MDKKALIGYVNEIASTTSLSDILVENESSGGRNSKLGKNQFRTMAELCDKTKSYEEIKLMMEYKISKGNGWNANIKDNQKCGEVILDYMERIKQNSNEDKILENLRYFFGYLYWKATVLVSENKSNNSSYNNARGGRR